MKKRILLFALFFIFLLPLASEAANEGEVYTKGILVDSPANHVEGGKMYVDVKAFTELVGASYQLNETGKTMTVNGSEIDIKNVNGVPTAHIRPLADAVGIKEVTWDPETNNVYVRDLEVLIQQSKKENELQKLGSSPATNKMFHEWVVLTSKWVFIISLPLFIVFLSLGLYFRIYKDEIHIRERVHVFFKGAEQRFKQKRVLSEDEEKLDRSFRVRVIRPIWTGLQKTVSNRMPKQLTKILEEKLRDAGYPFKLTPVNFRILQGILATVFFLIIVILFIPLTPDKGKIFILAGIVGYIGWIYPESYLKAKKRQRIMRIERSMSNFFDMVNLSIEAGMGFDAAVVKSCSYIKGPLADEFMIAINDMKLGKSKREAFMEMMNRVPSELFQSVVRGIVQAEQLGMGVSRVLRAQTQRIREKQRATAREKAMKVPVKMMIPMILFIFPSIFIVLLGPLVVHLITKGL